ncbi:MAG: PQQ-binding-like beta-propeller repeat protein [Bacteroidota bacterium]
MENISRHFYICKGVLKRWKQSVILLVGLSFFFSLSIRAQQAVLQFGWLTDTHIGFPAAERDLREIIADANSLHRQLRFLIVSGDVTEKGLDSELVLAKKVLSESRVPVFAVPGNHDTKWSESGTTTFPKLFGYSHCTFEEAGIRFICLNSGIPLRSGGHFSPEELRYLDSVLAVTRTSTPIILFFHHPPVETELDNSAKLFEHLNGYRVMFIGVGHGHANKSYTFGDNGVPGIMVRSTLSRNSTPGYTIVTVRTDSVIFSEKKPGTAEYQWHAIASHGIQVRSARDAVQGSKSNDSLSERARISWRTNLASTVTGSPVVADSLVIVGAFDGNVYALSLCGGEVRWKTYVGGFIVGTPARCDSLVYVGSTDGVFAALDVYSGKILWQGKTTRSSSIISSPVCWHDRVFFVSSDRTLRAVDRVTGHTIWVSQPTVGHVETRPAIADSLWIAGAWDGHLYGVSTTTGAVRWRWTENDNFYYSPAACFPVVAQGVVYVTTPDKHISAVNAATGETLWRTGITNAWESIGISADSSILYIRGLQDTVTAISIANALEPKILWQVRCGYGFDTALSMPVSARGRQEAAARDKVGVLFFGTKRGMVYALDPQHGEILWRQAVSDSSCAYVNTVAPVDRDHVVAANMDGVVVLIVGLSNE